MTKTSTLRRVTAFAGIALVLGLTACAPGSNEGSNELKTDNKQLSIEDWRQKNDDCMLAAGFDIRPSTNAEGVPSGSIDISGFDMTAFDAAYKKCGETVGPAPVDENIPTDEEIFESQLIFATCMREAGYDYPDPVKVSMGMSPAMGPEIDANIIDGCSDKAYGQETK